MEQYIKKAATLVAELTKRAKHNSTRAELDRSAFMAGRAEEDKDILAFLDTFEVREENSIWHNIDDAPNYNLNGISDFIIDSCYGHIEGEAHSYTPEQWSAHIGFNANRQFRWAYEKDLINFE